MNSLMLLTACAASLVQPDLGVGQVVVVDQHQVGALQSGELRDLGALAVDVELDPVPPGQPALAAVVQADRDAVRPEHGGDRRRLLGHRERGEAAVRVTLELGPQCVDPGRLQPLLGPLRQVPAGGLLQRREQVAEHRVAPRVLPEVLAHPGQEVLPAHVGDQLLEHGGALGVGDPVEVDLDGLDVGDVGGDRVGGRQLVLPVRPGLPGLGERGPRVRPAGGLGLRDRAGPGGERLVQPQVVPPAHGDQVAEPHVRHLVQDRLGAGLVGRRR